MKIDSVAFECEPLSYPPLLRVTMQGRPLRILLDFDRYYDDDDRVELAEEAKAEDYSLLLISMPKIEQDTEFTPDRLQSALQDNDRTERCSGFAPGAWNRQPVPDFIWKI